MKPWMIYADLGLVHLLMLILLVRLVRQEVLALMAEEDGPSRDASGDNRTFAQRHHPKTNP